MLLIAVLGAVVYLMTAEPASAPPVVPAESAAEAAPPRAPEAQVPSGRFTTAVEVRPILDATRASWVAVREYEGRDLLYFTQILSWRCGLREVRYGLNGAPPDTPVPLEPCHEDTASPNALVDVEGFPPHVEAPLGSIQSVDVTIVYDDGSEDGAVFARTSVLMP